MLMPAVEFEVPLSAQSIEFIMKEEGSRLQGIAIPLKIGHLDPVDVQTGQIARLNNLGYFAGPLDPLDEKLLLSAIEEFQCDKGLQVDGKCGLKTQAKLVEVHGSDLRLDEEQYIVRVDAWLTRTTRRQNPGHRQRQARREAEAIPILVAPATDGEFNTIRMGILPKGMLQHGRLPLPV